ncbi:MAG: tripartite tricarboxylate transporter TctB family protein [Beijerinckiaceae bacterium]|nr:tripartite tricarboxylate transporter TctB family protein [Beijerinckiaceae bacterium]
MTPDNPARGFDIPALVVAGLLFAAAGIVLYDISRQTIVSTYGVGPTAMPYVVACGLGLLGLAHLAVAFRGGLPKPEAADGGAVAWIIGGLVAFVAVIGLGGGFVIATALVFASVARGFGRRALAVDLAIGAGLGLVIFLVFAKLLTLLLPAGPLERLLV